MVYLTHEYVNGVLILVETPVSHSQGTDPVLQVAVSQMEGQFEISSLSSFEDTTSLSLSISSSELNPGPQVTRQIQEYQLSSNSEMQTVPNDPQMMSSNPPGWWYSFYITYQINYIFVHS